MVALNQLEMLKMRSLRAPNECFSLELKGELLVDHCKEMGSGHLSGVPSGLLGFEVDCFSNDGRHQFVRSPSCRRYLSNSLSHHALAYRARLSWVEFENSLSPRRRVLLQCRPYCHTRHSGRVIKSLAYAMTRAGLYPIFSNGSLQYAMMAA